MTLQLPTRETSNKIPTSKHTSRYTSGVLNQISVRSGIITAHFQNLSRCNEIPGRRIEIFNKASSEPVQPHLKGYIHTYSYYLNVTRSEVPTYITCTSSTKCKVVISRMWLRCLVGKYKGMLLRYCTHMYVDVCMYIA